MNAYPSSRITQPAERPRRKHIVTLGVSIVATLMMFGALLLVAPTADAQTRDAAKEAGFLSSLNQQRASRGVAPLTLLPSMSSAAGGWTSQMVNGSFLAHASDIKPGVPGGWSKIGENVGRGKSVGSLTQSFMASPGHARNVLDPDFTHVGIAVIVHPTGRVYTTHRFAALGTAPAPVVPVAAPAPVPTAPAPAPTPTVPPPVAAPPAAASPAPAVAPAPIAQAASPPPPSPTSATVPPSRPTSTVPPANDAATSAPTPTQPQARVTESRLNAATIPSWDDIDHVRAAAARKVATVRGARQPGRSG